MPQLTADQTQQMRALITSIWEVLIAAQGVSSRVAEVVDGTDGAGSMIDVGREIVAFVTDSRALFSARAAAALGL